MFAIVKTGGKQYKAEVEDVVIVDKLDGEEGAEVVISDVVMVVDGDKVKLGSPFVKGAEVKATIVLQPRRLTHLTTRPRRTSESDGATDNHKLTSRS
jgi:large subunit ribosomal protein L21